MQTEEFLRNIFQSYYKSNIIKGPPDLEQREFGVGEFGKKISSRHLHFSSSENFNSFLKKQTPFFVSYSSAYYKYPSARPMSAKQVLQTDLIYEFDADDIKTSCKQIHDSWKCGCGKTGVGAVKNCSSCGNGVKVDEWVCPECLGAVRKQVFRLLDFLENDFGITKGIFLNYSGSKGFHIHVRTNEFSKISNKARIELVDYLTAHELDFEKRGFVFSQKRFSSPRLNAASGWSKRILNSLVEVFEAGHPDEIAAMGGVSVKTVKQLLEQKKAVMSGFDKGILYSLPGEKTKKFWTNLIEFLVEKQKLDIDRQTSVDVSKIIRVPNTIHGETGLIAKGFSLKELELFDGLSDAVVFGDQPIKLKSVSAPKFYLGKQWWGPFKEEKVELPEFVSVYLLAKQHAVLV